MNLTCPNCSSEDTQKLSLVMSKGGVTEKGAQLGVAYGTNILIPLMTVFISMLVGFMFALFNPILGLLVFAGCLYGGFSLRKWLKAKTKSKYADVPESMKQNGFQCNRCEHLFIPARSASA